MKYTKKHIFGVQRRLRDLQVKVDFDAGEGTVSETKRIITLGDKIGTLPKPALEGKYFKEWDYSDGTKASATDTLVQNATLTAVYGDKPVYTEGYMKTNYAYFVTDFVPDTDTYAKIRIKTFKGGAGSHYVGFEDDTDSHDWRLFQSSNTWYFDAGEKRMTLDGQAENDWYECTVGNVHGVLEMQTPGGMTTGPVNTNDTPYKVLIGGGNSEDFYFDYARFYDQGDNLKAEFITVQDGDDVTCVYDTVSEKYYYNQNSSATPTFTAKE